MEDRMANVERALARLEVKVEHVDNRTDELLKGQAATQEAIQRGFHGTGDTPGLVVRVDRLTQWKSRHAKITMVVLGALLPLMAARIWELVIGQT